METVSFWRPAEAARRLGLSKTTFYELVKSGHLPRPMKLGARMSLWDAATLVQAYRALLKEGHHNA